LKVLYNYFSTITIIVLVCTAAEGVLMMDVNSRGYKILRISRGKYLTVADNMLMICIIVWIQKPLSPASVFSI